MKVEILIFDGCPNIKPTEQLVKEILNVLKIETEVKMVFVADHNDAVSNRFLGSPSVRINGKDIELEENELTEYSMRCRMYNEDGKLSGVPPKHLIEQKLREAIS